MNARSRIALCCLMSAAVFEPECSWAAKKTGRSTAIVSPSEIETVELFGAMAAGQIDVKFIAKSEKQGRVRIRNKTDRPLNVSLPDVFAARPVLAQFGPQAQGAQNAGQNGAPQNLGSTFNGPNGNLRMFNVPAEKTGDLRVNCVCLDYGKPTPRSAMAYEVVPLVKISDDRSLAVLLAKLEVGNQSEVQAAAWHLANKMTWEEIARIRLEHLIELSEPYFTFGELKRAKDLVLEVGKTARASEADGVGN